MTIVETFADFVSAAADVSDPDRLPNRYGRLRAGQAAFNLLSTVRDDIAELLRGSDFDPFYNDARLPLFYDFVMRHWDDDKKEF